MYIYICFFPKMEELRAHATDWTQNIQNMSMDFRIPVPLDLNDPFQLHRRRRRKRRRGAHHRHPRLTVDGLPHGVSLEVNSIKENGHLFVNWPGSRFNSASDTRLVGRRSQMFSLIYAVFLIQLFKKPGQLQCNVTCWLCLDYIRVMRRDLDHAWHQDKAQGLSHALN